MNGFNYYFTVLFFLMPFFFQAQTTFKVPANPYETCIVDYDLDGDNDIVVGCNMNFENDSIVFFINDKWGNFEQQQFVANGGGFLYCVDLTSDLYPDLITRDADSIFFYKNSQTIGIGTGYFIKDTYGNPYIGGIADINMDGIKDIVYYDITTPWSLGVAFNNGDYTFSDFTLIASNGTNLFPSVGYVNDDNAPNILVTTLNQSKSVNILYNEYPSFEKQNIATPDWNRGYILNVNNDNLNDVLLFRVSYFGDFPLVNLINEEVHFNNCDTLTFVNGTEIKNIRDYNLDGYDDFATTVYQANNQPIEDSVYIYFNDQHCGYTHVQSIYIGDYSWLPTINSGDLNGDGYPELVIQGFNMPTSDNIRILWNDSTGHFIDTNSVYVHQNENRLNDEKVIKIFPNPTKGKTTIFYTLNQSADVNLEVFDHLGKTVKRLNFASQKEGENKVELNLSGLPTGIYFYSLFVNGQLTDTKKMVVK